MPLPKPTPDESNKQFMSRCMADDKAQEEYPDSQQRVAVCLSMATNNNILSSMNEFLKASIEEEIGFTEEITKSNIYIPVDNEYLNFNTDDDSTLFEEISIAVYKYENPITKEVFYFNRKGPHRKNGRYLLYRGEASEYQGKKVKLNKPFRTTDGPKKFSVYVKNDKDNIVKVNFGDPNMSIKRDDPQRRKNFRARHQCDTNPGPKWKARYWSCKFWESNKSVTELLK